MSHSRLSLKTWIVLTAIGTLVFLINIDYTAVNLTLLPISEEINADLSSLQWLLSAYALIWSACVVLAGRFADVYGKRSCLIMGLLIFMAASCLTGVAENLSLLMVGRILQGLGVALFSAPAWAFIFELAPPQHQGFVMGVVTSFAGLGLAMGPTLGGFIIETLNWRWIFYVNIPLGILVISILFLFTAKDSLPKQTEKINWLQAFLLAAALCVSIYLLNEIDNPHLELSLFIIPLFLWGLLIFSFIFSKPHKNQHKLPWLSKLGAYETLIPYSLLKNKPFMTVTFSVMTLSMIFSMTLVLMGLYLQNTLNYSTYETGLIFIAMTITMGFLGPISGKIIDFFGTKHLLISGALLTALSTAMMACFSTETSLTFVLSALFLLGAGLGLHFTAGNTAMMQATPQKDLAVASGVYMMFMMLGNTLSVVLTTNITIIFGRIHLLNSLKAMPFSPEQHNQLVNAIAQVEHSPAQLTNFAADLIPALLDAIDKAFLYGVMLNMIGGTILVLTATFFTACNLKKSPHQK